MFSLIYIRTSPFAALLVQCSMLWVNVINRVVLFDSWYGDSNDIKINFGGW